MRGPDRRSEGLFSYVSCESRVPAEHPLRSILPMTDAALAALNGEFQQLYALNGRPSIAREKLLRALLLQAFYSVRSERQLMEQLDYNLLFVAGMARGPAVDRRAPVGSVPGDMRGDLEVAHRCDKAGHVEVLVTADGERMPAGHGCQYRLGHVALGGAVASLTRPSTSRPCRFSIRAWPMNDSLASLPLPLRNSLASGSVVELWVSLRRFSRWMLIGVE